MIRGFPVCVPAQDGLRLVELSGSLAAVVFSVLLCCSAAWGETVEQWQGRTYTQLPQNLCPRYTDMLLEDASKPNPYGGVICDRPEATYVLLQKLVRQTDQGQAVWQVLKVKAIRRVTPNSLVVGTNCQARWSSASAAAVDPVFALVEPTATNTYKTLSAWRVNLSTLSFASLNPQQVTCQEGIVGLW